MDSTISDTNADWHHHNQIVARDRHRSLNCDSSVERKHMTNLTIKPSPKPDKILQHSLNLLLLFTVLLLTPQVSRSQLLPQDPKCQPIGSVFCNIVNYKTLQPFTNALGHTSLEAAKADLHRYAFLIESCKNKIQLFLCSLYLPVCVTQTEVTTKLLLPCREICEEARSCLPTMERVANMSWPSEWECSNFQYYTKDALCVINNQRENQQGANDPSRLTPAEEQHMSTTKPPATHLEINNKVANPTPRESHSTLVSENISVCDSGFFDCRLSDVKRPLCIETKYVCDGKKDCLRDDSIHELNEGRDELDCRERCEDGQLYCDDSCINRHEICNGKVDCSSGIDEQDCNGSLIDMIMGIIFAIIALILGAVLAHQCFVCCWKVCVTEAKQPQPDAKREEDDLCNNPHPVFNHKTITHIPVIQHLASHERFSNDYMQEPMYHEPSVLMKSDYERVTAGGYSGASSIYGAYSVYLVDDPNKLPAAPPPTPALEKDIYSSINLPNFYANLKE